jgi:hypothetical protein
VRLLQASNGRHEAIPRLQEVSGYHPCVTREAMRLNCDPLLGQPFHLGLGFGDLAFGALQLPVDRHALSSTTASSGPSPREGLHRRERHEPDWQLIRTFRRQSLAAVAARTAATVAAAASRSAARTTERSRAGCARGRLPIDARITLAIDAAGATRGRARRVGRKRGSAQDCQRTEDAEKSNHDLAPLRMLSPLSATTIRVRRATTHSSC